MAKSTRPTPNLSRDDIVARAMAIADERGLGAVSVRGLAAEFSVTPMALYWHFENKEALFDAMAARAAAEVDFKDDPSQPWQKRLRHVLGTVLDQFGEHPWMPSLVKGRVVTAPEYLVALEALLDSIRVAGFDETDAVFVADYAVDCVSAMAAQRAAAARAVVPKEWQTRKRRQIQEAAAAEFPRVDESMVPLTEAQSADRYVELAFEILISGIEAAARGAR